MRINRSIPSKTQAIGNGMTVTTWSDQHCGYARLSGRDDDGIGFTKTLSTPSGSSLNLFLAAIERIIGTVYMETHKGLLQESVEKDSLHNKCNCGAKHDSL